MRYLFLIMHLLLQLTGCRPDQCNLTARPSPRLSCHLQKSNNGILRATGFTHAGNRTFNLDCNYWQGQEISMTAPNPLIRSASIAQKSLSQTEYVIVEFQYDEFLSPCCSSVRIQVTHKP